MEITIQTEVITKLFGEYIFLKRLVHWIKNEIYGYNIKACVWFYNRQTIIFNFKILVFLKDFKKEFWRMALLVIWLFYLKIILPH